MYLYKIYLDEDYERPYWLDMWHPVLKTEEQIYEDIAEVCLQFKDRVIEDRFHNDWLHTDVNYGKPIAIGVNDFTFQPTVDIIPEFEKLGYMQDPVVEPNLTIRLDSYGILYNLTEEGDIAEDSDYCSEPNKKLHEQLRNKVGKLTYPKRRKKDETK